jgi:cephalosporin hydroxylase
MDKIIKGRVTYTPINTKNILTSQQNENMFFAFNELILKVRPSKVLEIGTAGGGTIAYIRDTLDKNEMSKTQVKTFDIKEHKWYDDLRNRNIDVVIENIFSKSYRELEKPHLIKPFIESEGVTLVLCDGGSKINEFRLLSQFLKSGDIIMAHDYIDTKENYEMNYKNKIWNWREIGIEHVDPVCIQYELEPYMQDFFNSAVWVCRRKK